jgi:multisubunit Na+/H+ antiporter MnhE subunit
MMATDLGKTAEQEPQLSAGGMMRALPEVLFWWAACVALWLLTLSSVSLPELLVAAGCALPCAVLAVVARRAVGGSWPVQPRWAWWLLPLPAAVVADGVRVLGRAAGVLVGRRMPSGRVRTVELHRDHAAGRWRTRQALASLLVTATPGTVVLDIAEDSGEMCVHALGAGAPSMEDVVRR